MWPAILLWGESVSFTVPTPPASASQAMRCMVADAPLASLKVAGSSTPLVLPATTALPSCYGVEERLMQRSPLALSQCTN